MSQIRHVMALTAISLLVLVAAPASGQEAFSLRPIGRPETREGLHVAAAYLAFGVASEPPSGSRPPGPAIHLQVGIDAVDGNPYGFEAEDSIPYLRVPFTLVFTGTGWRREGILEPMVSRNGFHYGATVTVPGDGDYVLTIEVQPPQGLVRHTDPHTGVAAWWKPFPLSWGFRYAQPD